MTSVIKNKSRFFLREREGGEGAPCPSRAGSGSLRVSGRRGECSCASPGSERLPAASWQPTVTGLLPQCSPPGPPLSAHRLWPPRSSHHPSIPSCRPAGKGSDTGATSRGACGQQSTRQNNCAFLFLSVLGCPSAAGVPRGGCDVPCRSVLVSVMRVSAAAHTRAACHLRQVPLPRQGRSC